MNNKRIFLNTYTCMAAAFVLVLALAPLAQPVHAAPFPAAASFEDIDDYIEGQIDKLNIPGASLAIIEGDEIVYSKGFGVAGSGEAPTAQTPFFIGSATKSFTALAVMQLVEAGKVELDAPVQRYLPWFTLADAGAAAQITVRHLLIQTSGISQIPGMIDMANFDNTPGSSERQARALASYELTRPVGSSWEYSNINFNLLGLVIEAASGESYAAYVQNHIFTPLHMNHSYTSKTTAQQDGLALGHQMWFGYPVAVPDLTVPGGSLASGQLIASAEDMAHYLIAQLNGGKYKDVQILSPEGIAQMHQPAAKIVMAGSQMGDYGMGWFIDEKSRERLVYHHGEVPDNFTYMALLPQHDRAIILLFNANQQIYNYALWDTGETAALWLAGIPLGSDNWGAIPWALRACLLLPLLQIIIIAATLRRIKGWRLDDTHRPGTVRMWLLHILLPGLVDLALAAIAAVILASGLLKFLMLFMGDLTSLFLLSGGIALAWLVIRTPLILSTLRTPRA